jgi:hypothetical protein
MIVSGTALGWKVGMSLILWTAAGLFFYMARIGVVGDNIDVRQFPRVLQLAIRLLMLSSGVFFAIVSIVAIAGVISWTDLIGGT